MSQALEKLSALQESRRSVVCVGLDSDIGRIPERFLDEEYPQFAFNRWVIEETCQHVCAYKLNMAFYEVLGSTGIKALELTLRYLRSEYPQILTIADAKRGDIGNTAASYASCIFDQLNFDMVTVNPYLGSEALAPFLSYKDRGIIVVVKTSNPGGGELQDLLVDASDDKERTVLSERTVLQLWEYVLSRVVKEWNEFGNCAAVIGATYPKQLEAARLLAPRLPFLVPGVGAQGGSMTEVIEGAFGGWGSVVVNSSRGIIFAESPGEAVADLVEQARQIISS